MNSIKIYFSLYSMFITSAWLNYFRSSAEPYTIDSHMHGEHLVINVTCLDSNDKEPVNNPLIVRRSLSPYGTYEHGVPSSGLNVADGPPLSDIKSGPSNTHTTNKKKNSLIKEREKDDRKASGKGDGSGSDDLSESNHSHPKPNLSSQTLLSVDCDFVQVSSNMLNSSTHKLKIKSSGTLELTSDWAKNSPDLSRLIIRSDNGLVLPPDCSWVPRLTENLDLAYTPLNNFTLYNCPSSLKKLQLQGASLQDLSICITSLEDLDVSWNVLSEEHLAQDCPQMTKNVKQLKLHNNEMSSWSFCNWPELIYLELQNNNIQNIEFTACLPHNLLHLDLSHNKLVSPPLGYPSKLSYISLSYNRLEEISHFNRGIQEVDLSHNNLNLIGKGVFRSASNLLSLSLSHNHLTVIYGHDFNGLNALRYLDLSYNAITHIRHEAFLPLRQIMELRINSNSLHQLDARLMAKLPSKLLHFSVSDNPWRCSCHLLASLSQASTSKCRPNCREMPELTCREGKRDVSAQDVLRQCIEAVQETDLTRPVHAIDRQTSDEDVSEELVTSSYGSSPYYALIPIAVLFLAIPVVAVGIRKVYLNRKRILRRCNCVSSAPSDSESTHARWSAQYMPNDSDSETEF